MRDAPRWAAPLLVAALTAAVYWPVLGNGFVWDDDMHITRSALTAAPDGWSRIWASREAMQYYPLSFSAFRLERAAFGLDPRGYHAVSLLLQALNAVLLGFLLSRLRLPGAWWAAALFAVHPLGVETVAWATELKNLLCLLFALLCARSWLDYGESRRPRDYALALAAYAACLLSKTAACLLPLVLLAADWARGRRVDKRAFLRLAPFLALGGALAAVTVLYERYRHGADPEFALSWVRRPLLAGQTFWFYLLKLARPAPLSFIAHRWTLDPASPAQWGPLAASFLLGAGLWASRRSLGRAPFAAFAAYALLVFPVLGFFDVFFMRFSWVADHFAYLAMIPVLALVPAAVERLSRSPGVRAGVLGLLVLSCAWTARARTADFLDAETLWRDTVAKNPTAWMAYDNLAVEETARGAFDAAAEHASRAVSLMPGLGVGWFHLGTALWGTGDHPSAAAAFERSLDVAPRYRAEAAPRLALAQTYLGLRELERGRPAAAAERMRLAAEAAPERAAGWFNLARASLGAGRREDASAACARGLALAPDSPDGAQCRGLARAR